MGAIIANDYAFKEEYFCEMVAHSQHADGINEPGRCDPKSITQSAEDGCEEHSQYDVRADISYWLMNAGSTFTRIQGWALTIFIAFHYSLIIQPPNFMIMIAVCSQEEPLDKSSKL